MADEGTIFVASWNKEARSLLFERFRDLSVGRVNAGALFFDMTSYRAGEEGGLLLPAYLCTGAAAVQGLPRSRLFTEQGKAVSCLA